MLHIGHPIIADKLYAGHSELRLSQLTSLSTEKPGLRERRTDERNRAGGNRVSEPPAAPTLASSAAPADITLISRQALHAYRLEVRHPVTDKPLVFEAAMPEDIARTLEALRRHRAVRREGR
jgi:23S rRNA pseudouridine1911/1915/1917 synthase